MTTASVSPALASHSISSTTGAIQACGDGSASPNSSVKVTHISRQCFILRWPNDSLWTGDYVSESWGELSLFLCLPPVCCSMGWLFCLAFCLKVSFRCFVTWVTWFGSHWHEFSGCELKLQIQSFFVGAKALARNNINYLVCGNCFLVTLCGNLFICHQRGSCTNVRMPPAREKGSHLPPRTTKLCNLRNRHNSITAPTVEPDLGFSSW